jgi:hypothetical protein
LRTGGFGCRRAFFHARRVEGNSGPKRVSDRFCAEGGGEVKVAKVEAGTEGGVGSAGSVGGSAVGGGESVGRCGSAHSLGGGIGGKGGDIGRVDSHENGGGGASGEFLFTRGIFGRGPCNSRGAERRQNHVAHTLIGLCRLQ